MIRVKNDTIWGQIRILFLASALLFLENIYFGFDNTLTDGIIPRWQILVHLHAGTLGSMDKLITALPIFMPGA